MEAIPVDFWNLTAIRVHGMPEGWKWCSLDAHNKPEDFVLALVEFLDHDRQNVRYLRRPFERSGITTDFNGASVDFPFADLLSRAGDPS